MTGRNIVQIIELIIVLGFFVGIPILLVHLSDQYIKDQEARNWIPISMEKK